MVVAGVTSMRDDVVRIREGDLMSLRSRVNQLELENDRLRHALSEHHAVGALENMKVGDQCPICERFAKWPGER